MPDPSAAQGAIEITVDGVVIKGYHIFRLSPLLRVVPGPDNPLDKDAMVVVMSPLDSIPTADHDVVTDISLSTECMSPSTAGNRKDRLEEIHNQWKQLDPETKLQYEERARSGELRQRYGEEAPPQSEEEALMDCQESESQDEDAEMDQLRLLEEAAAVSVAKAVMGNYYPTRRRARPSALWNCDWCYSYPIAQVEIRVGYVQGQRKDHKHPCKMDMMLNVTQRISIHHLCAGNASVPLEEHKKRLAKSSQKRKRKKEVPMEDVSCAEQSTPVSTSAEPTTPEPPTVVPESEILEEAGEHGFILVATKETGTLVLVKYQDINERHMSASLRIDIEEERTWQLKAQRRRRELQKAQDSWSEKSRKRAEEIMDKVYMSSESKGEEDQLAEPRFTVHRLTWESKALRKLKDELDQVCPKKRVLLGWCRMSCPTGSYPKAPPRGHAHHKLNISDDTQLILRVRWHRAAGTDVEVYCRRFEKGQAIAVNKGEHCKVPGVITTAYVVHYPGYYTRYHIFRRSPLLDLRMRVVPEPDNTLDKDAMVVVMSPLDSVPTADHDVVTDISSSTECPSTTGNRKDRLEEVHNQWKQLDPETKLQYEERHRQAKFVTIEDLTL
ncbi:hypothetical protein Bbelb_186750 [Branchiostoma belcheri]|nr:hypothetical protein Bbelb_186750 [Branchiostoma belcheri]